MKIHRINLTRTYGSARRAPRAHGMRVVCCACGTVIARGMEPVSHSYCPPCEAAFVALLDARLLATPGLA